MEHLEQERHIRLPALNDPEDNRVPDSLPFIVDAHVHVFPSAIFNAIREWFDQFAWPIRYRFGSKEVIDYLLSRGVGHVVAFQYAHKPGMADFLNQYMKHLCETYPGRVTGMATVFPGEENAGSILENAFSMGLKGVKLHAHVQCFDTNADEMTEIYETCQAAGKPLVMHVSREPKSPAYKCDPYLLCGADKLERVLVDFPRLKICVPHLGVDEFVPYRHLIEKYDTLWLDTAMALTDYFPVVNPVKLSDLRIDRVIYGSDFPNIPYAWDRELKWISAGGFDPCLLERVLWKNAADFFGLDQSAGRPERL